MSPAQLACVAMLALGFFLGLVCGSLQGYEDGYEDGTSTITTVSQECEDFEILNKQDGTVVLSIRLEE